MELALIVVILALCQGLTHCDLVSSSGDLSRVLRMEREVVEALERHKDALEGSAAAVREFAKEVIKYFTYRSYI